MAASQKNHPPLLLLILLLSSSSISGQIPNLLSPDSMVYPVQLNHIGEITFMDRNIPLEQYKEEDFLQTFTLSRSTSLNIRVFMNNSVINYLHQLAPELGPEELLENGNLQFSFFIDGNFIYKENIHHGCNFGRGGSKHTATTFRVPFTSITGEDWWAMYMWDRFLQSGGEKALTTGAHLLSVEIRPYLNAGADQQVKVGDLIASGSIQLEVKDQKIKSKQIAIQRIKPNSGWEVGHPHFDNKIIRELNKKIAGYTLKEITSILVIENNKLIIEEYFNGADRNTLHDTRSATKSFTSTLMGLAIEDGYIRNENEALAGFYDLKAYPNYAPQKDSVTIKDLLTMSSAFEGSDLDGNSPGNEENMYPTDNWVDFALSLPMDTRKTNGQQWDYFTAGVVLLGDILDKRVPEGLEKYAEEKLFGPLQISHYQWQYTPQHVVNTAGSLQMTALDYAKFAQLYKNEGAWNGVQLLPKSWVSNTCSKQIPITQRENEYYGFLFWNKTFTLNGKEYEVYYCAGNGGNEFLIFKDLPLTIVITSQAYNKPYAHPQTDRIVQEFLLPAFLK